MTKLLFLTTQVRNLWWLAVAYLRRLVLVSLEVLAEPHVPVSGQSATTELTLYLSYIYKCFSWLKTAYTVPEMEPQKGRWAFSMPVWRREVNQPVLTKAFLQPANVVPCAWCPMLKPAYLISLFFASTKPIFKNRSNQLITCSQWIRV